MAPPRPAAIALRGADAARRVSADGRGARGDVATRFDRLQRAPEDDGWTADAEAGPPPATQVADERVRRILSRNDSPDIGFDQAINPYRGCEHGCTYCYARPTHSYLGLSPGLEFETRLVAKVDAAAALRRELSARGYRCRPIQLGSATDAYQPVERTRRLTRAVLEVLAETGHPVTITTKGALIERDLDLLAPMAARGLVDVDVTVTTLDPALARAWEPRASAPWRRLETIRRLAEAGVPVGVSIAPVAPFLNEPELEQVMAAAREAGARRAHYVVLRLPDELRQVFEDWLRARFPERADRVMRRLFDLRGGRANDPRFGSRMRGEGAWAELLRLRFDVAMRRLGLQRDRMPLRCDLFVPPAREDGQLGLFSAVVREDGDRP